jgi:hypothetical protein
MEFFNGECGILLQVNMGLVTNIHLLFGLACNASLYGGNAILSKGS